MEPKEFADYWKLSPAEVAAVLNRSRDSVYQWLSGNKPASPEVLREVQMMHMVWLGRKLQEEMMAPHIWEIYETARDRRELKKPDEPRHEDN